MNTAIALILYFALVIGVIAWLTVLPTVGLLYLLGWLA